MSSRSQLSRSTKSDILFSLTSICGDKSGQSRSRKRKLVSKPPSLFVTQTTTSSMSTSTLKFLLSSVRPNVWVVLESTFPSQLRLSCCKKRSSSTITMNYSLCSENTTESSTRLDPTPNRCLFLTLRISNTSCDLVWWLSLGLQWILMVIWITFIKVWPNLSNSLSTSTILWRTVSRTTLRLFQRQCS